MKEYPFTFHQHYSTTWMKFTTFLIYLDFLPSNMYLNFITIFDIFQVLSFSIFSEGQHISIIIHLKQLTSYILFYSIPIHKIMFSAVYWYTYGYLRSSYDSIFSPFGQITNFYPFSFDMVHIHRHLVYSLKWIIGVFVFVLTVTTFSYILLFVAFFDFLDTFRFLLSTMYLFYYIIITDFIIL